jgi:glycogen debranching enzyme
MRALPAAMLHDRTLGNKTECLVTNGTGSFASLAINGGLSRKFHGLLIHAAVPPMDRMLTWHGCIERLDGHSLDARCWLSGNDVTSDAGERYLTHFCATPLPTWLYQVGGSLLQKELFMVQGQDTTVIRYTLLSAPTQSVTLNLANYVHFRPAGDHCQKLSAHDIQDWAVHAAQHCVQAMGTSLRLDCQTPGERSHQRCHWLAPSVDQQCHDLLYAIELEDQGYPQRDSSLKIHQADIDLYVGESCYMVGTLAEHCPDGSIEYQRTLTRREQRYHPNDFANDLAHSALQLVADRESVQSKTILAGFPWFGDWGRDTMIALPGMTLVTGQFDIARSILKTFAYYLNGGMLPNKFPDRRGDDLKYNSIDATLWFFWAIQQYIEYSGDWDFVQAELYDDLKDIIHAHQRGTRYGISMADDGLIQGGDSDTQLTWMDVQFDGYAVTPRYGKAVEINALWYNALCFAQQCSDRFEDHASQYQALMRTVKSSFQTLFWNDTLQCLYDCVTPEQTIDDVRCNQIIAVSLPYSPLDPAQQAAVLQVVHQQLYTPVGLRSLSTGHSDYRGQYYGALRERDLAYHQGTVWAWPMGAFIDAVMKVHNDPVLAAQLLTGLKHHLYHEAGIQGVSEVFDGDAPHKARGCFHQAWSVAECLRVVSQYGLEVPD